MRPLLLVLLALLFVPVPLVALNFVGPTANATYERVPELPAAPPAKLTMNRYLALQEGMTWTEVYLALGVNSEEVQTAGQFTTYEFRDRERFVIATFQSGRLVAKLQSGL